jgi:hypothetical protein
MAFASSQDRTPSRIASSHIGLRCGVLLHRRLRPREQRGIRGRGADLLSDRPGGDANDRRDTEVGANHL